MRSSASHARHPPRTILMTLRPTSEPPTLVPTNGPSQFPTLVPTSAPEPPVTVSAGGAYTAQHAARPDRRNSATWRYVARGASAHRRRSRCAGDSARCSSVLCTSNLTHSRGPIVWNARARCSCVAKAAHVAAAAAVTRGRAIRMARGRQQATCHVADKGTTTLMRARAGG